MSILFLDVLREFSGGTGREAYLLALRKTVKPKQKIAAQLTNLHKPRTWIVYLFSVRNPEKVEGPSQWFPVGAPKCITIYGRLRTYILETEFPQSAFVRI